MRRVSLIGVVLAALKVTLAWAIRVFRPPNTFTAFFSAFFLFASAFWVVFIVVTIFWAASEF